MSILGDTGVATYQIGLTSGDTEIYSSKASDSLIFTEISVAEVRDARFTSDGFAIITLDNGSKVSISSGGINQAIFSDGVTASFVQLSSSRFTIGDTTFSKVDAALAQVGADPLIVPASRAVQNLTLFGDGDLGNLQASCRLNTVFTLLV